jgi:alkylhydroperoxidase family enzyme
MSESFRIYSPETAPAAAQPLLAAARKNFGLVPNVLGVMAESPVTLEAYLTLGQIFSNKSGFTPTEQHVVLQTINAANACHYCTLAHATIAVNALKFDASEDLAIREGRPLSNAKLEALRLFAHEIVMTRGWIKDAALQAFLAAGYTRAQAFEVILGAGMKTLTNYINHIANTPIDAAFQRMARAA